MYYDMYLKIRRIHQKSQLEFEKLKKINSRLLLKIDQIERENKDLKNKLLILANVNTKSQSVVKKKPVRNKRQPKATSTTVAIEEK
tara:strand:+ start:326 stop:583 length:258 start_codon:yes stop_codon:yes gene_type:complete